MDIEYKIASADCETDPFAPDRRPFPFVWGFETNDTPFQFFWGDTFEPGNKKRYRTREAIAKDCTQQFLDFLEDLDEPHCIYMHNGGKFDFMFLMHAFCDEAMIIDGRIVKANLFHHQVRDSYMAVPVPLKAYQKDDIDYALLEIDKREDYKHDILKYLGGDCRYLLEMMTDWRAEFGDTLTMASAAMRELKKHHKYNRLESLEDDEFYRQFYFGGRNQCFEVGEITGPLAVYDKNSSYPHVMRDYAHPLTDTFSSSSELTEETDLLIVSGTNRGALCAKDSEGYLSFTTERGQYDAQYGQCFYTTGHELRAALQTGTFTIDKIHKALTASVRGTFAEFIDFHYGKRMEFAALEKAYEKAGDFEGARKMALQVLFRKLVLNSSYGKFALDCRDHMDWMITELDEFAMDPDEWDMKYSGDDWIFWQKPAKRKSLYNVATAASITGAARAELLLGAARATRLVYCDTDSLICESLDVDADSKRLGAWKLEAQGDAIYIAGKKLYALYSGGKPWSEIKNGQTKYKKASKGVNLTAEQIRTVALGGVVEYANPAPAFDLSGGCSFISREIKMTARNVKRFGE